MSYLKKEQYEARANNAAQNMADNKDIDTLTEEQHDALAQVCSIRHVLHGNNQKAVFFSNYANHSDWYTYLDNSFSGEQGVINTLLQEAGLPIIEGLQLSEDLPSDNDSEFLSIEEMADTCNFDNEDNLEDEDYEEAVIEAYTSYGTQKCYQAAELINDLIEQYLKNIDQEHGTSYCPTGALRV